MLFAITQNVWDYKWGVVELRNRRSKVRYVSDSLVKCSQELRRLLTQTRGNYRVDPEAPTQPVTMEIEMQLAGA